MPVVGHSLAKTPSGGQLACPDEPSLQDEVRQMSGKRLKWSPQKGRYLVATCLSGQMTHRLTCLGRYIRAAALLGRTLVIPMEDLSNSTSSTGAWSRGQLAIYNYSVIVDLAHLRSCFGDTSAVLTREEAAAAQGLLPSNEKIAENGKSGNGVLKVDRLFCWGDSCQPLASLASNALLAMPNERENVAAASVAPPPGVRWDDLAVSMQRMRAEATPVISLGDLAALQPEDGDEPEGSEYGLGVGFDTPCLLLLKPHEGVVEAAEGFTDEYTGALFAAVHLRRGDMLEHAPSRQLPYWPLRQVAECLRRQLAGMGVRMVFVATDADEHQVELLRAALLAPAGTPHSPHSLQPPPPPPLTLVRLPAMAGRFWARRLTEAGLAADAAAIAATEKLVCAMAAAFFSTPGSSFSGHIHAMRRGFGMPACRDAAICHDSGSGTGSATANVEPELTPRGPALWHGSCATAVCTAGEVATRARLPSTKLATALDLERASKGGAGVAVGNFGDTREGVLRHHSHHFHTYGSYISIITSCFCAK
eukprot:jgi/Mesen1/7642/ME000004S07913